MSSDFILLPVIPIDIGVTENLCKKILVYIRLFAMRYPVNKKQRQKCRCFSHYLAVFTSAASFHVNSHCTSQKYIIKDIENFITVHVSVVCLSGGKCT